MLNEHPRRNREVHRGGRRKPKGTLVVDLSVRAHTSGGTPDEMRAAVKALVAGAALVMGSGRDLGTLAGKRGVSWLEENAKRRATWT